MCRVCHVVRDHQTFDEFSGPRFIIPAAEVEMHPLDTLDRREIIRENIGIGYCNVTQVLHRS